MTEELETMPTIPKKKRSKRRFKRKPLSDKPGYVPKPKQSNLALTEIDSRLAQAIRDRSEAMAKVSELVHWQDRLGRLEQEINSLIGFQNRLSGVDRIEVHGQTADGRYTSSLATLPAPSFGGHLSPIPDGVTSIPAGKGPKPTTQNVADVVGGEGGFS